MNEMNEMNTSMTTNNPRRTFPKWVGFAKLNPFVMTQTMLKTGTGADVSYSWQLHWSGDAPAEDLDAFLADHLSLLMIAKAVATMPLAYNDSDYCVFCEKTASNTDLVHADDCPVTLARTFFYGPFTD